MKGSLFETGPHPQSSALRRPVTLQRAPAPVSVRDVAAAGVAADLSRAEGLGHRFDRIEIAERNVVQRAQTEKERGDKFQRKALGTATITKLGNNLKGTLDEHIFKAVPADGGAVNHNAPTGLHAYTNGALPSKIAKDRARGSPADVHELRWYWDVPPGRQPAANQMKESTMFPIWMPAEHVRTLIQLEHKSTRASAVEDPLNRDETEEYILQGHTVPIKKAGDTVYPVKE